MPVTPETTYFIVDFTPAEATKLLNATGKQGAAVARMFEDDNMAFNAGGEHLSIAYEYREFRGKYMDLRTLLKMANISAAMEHATPVLTKIMDDRLNDARAECRKTFGDPDFKDAEIPDFDPDSRAGEAMGSALRQCDGLVLGRDHKDEQSCYAVMEMLNDDAPAEMLFLEEFSSSLQADLNAYLSGPRDAELSAELTKRCAELKGHYLQGSDFDWIEILAKAKQKGVKLFGIDMVNAEPGVPSEDPAYGERRVAIMNAHAKDIIDQAKNNNPGSKFVVMCGTAHMNTHIGGVPGLAQMMDVPGVKVDPSGKMRVTPDNKHLREMPSPVHQAFIDAAMAKATQHYETVTPKDPSSLDSGEVRRVMERVAKELATANKLPDIDAVEAALNDNKCTDAIADICARTQDRTKRKADIATAIAGNNLDAVRTLLDEDPDLVLQLHDTSDKQTLLHEACDSDNDALALILLEKGANPNALNSNGDGAVHLAAAMNIRGESAAALMKELIASDADFDMPGSSSKSAYDTAVENGKPKALEALLSEGKGSMADLWEGHFVKMAQDRYSNVREAGDEDFNLGELKALARSRFDELDASVGFPTIDSVEQTINVDDSSWDAVDDLIKITQARKQNRSDMLAAIKSGNADDAKRILSDDPLFATLAISERRTALNLAAIEGKNSVIEALISGGCDPNHVNPRGRTTLHSVLNRDVKKTDRVAQKALTATVSVLLDNGADINAQDRGGRTALHLAGFHNNVSAIDELASRDDLDPTITDVRGWTAHDMTLGSTNKEAEAALTKHNLATNTPPIEEGTHSSVDILCMMTLCDNPTRDEHEMRLMYEQLYAVPAMRPILDLAAAAGCNDRKPPKGGLRIFASGTNVVGPLFGQTLGPSGAYDEKVNSLLIPMKSDSKEGTPLGTLAHEMTHLTAHLISNHEDALPFTTQQEKQAYLNAINADIRKLHLLNDDDPANAVIKERVSGRMASYGQKKMTETDYVGADLRLLQEHVVSVPQLIATYGPDYVREHCTAMMGFFETFSAQAAETLQTDPRFAAGRATIDTAMNDTLIERVERKNVAPRAPEKAFKNTTSLDVSVDTVLNKLTGEYMSRYANRKAIDPAGGPSIAFSADDYELDQDHDKALKKKLKAIKKILSETMAPDELARRMEPSALKLLIVELGEAMETGSEKEMTNAVTRISATWIKQTKIDFVENRITAGNSVRASELAEAAVYRAEMVAMGGSGEGDDWTDAAFIADSKKRQQALIDALKDELSAPENANLLAKPPESLLTDVRNAITLTGAVYLDRRPKRIGRRDLTKVTINKVEDSDRHAWMAALANVPR